MLCNKTVKITFCGHRDVIEYNGKQWRVAQTGFNMSFENLDENDYAWLVTRCDMYGDKGNELRNLRFNVFQGNFRTKRKISKI